MIVMICGLIGAGKIQIRKKEPRIALLRRVNGSAGDCALTVRIMAVCLYWVVWRG